MSVPTDEPNLHIVDVPGVRSSVNGHLATIRISRDDKRNALTIAMWNQLAQLVESAQENAAVRAIIITGTGEAFSAGADLREVYEATKSRQAAEEHCHSVVRALRQLAMSSVPTISAVNGMAAGGGVEIALVTDARIAKRSATFRLPMMQLGVVPDRITISRLTGSLGESRARWLLLTGQTITSRQAYETGLVDEVVSSGKFEATVRRAASAAVCANAPAFYATKQGINGEISSMNVETAASEMVESYLQGHVRTAAHKFLSARRRTDAYAEEEK